MNYKIIFLKLVIIMVFVGSTFGVWRGVVDNASVGEIIALSIWCGIGGAVLPLAAWAVAYSVYFLIFVWE